jgi:hypothetical protein
MSDTGLRKAGAGAGIVFAVLTIATFATLSGSPEFADDRATINTYFLDNEGKLFGTAVFAMVAGFALAWFANGLRDALSADGAAGGRLVAIGGTITATSYAISGAVLAVGAQRVSDHGAEGAEAAFINFDLFIVTFGAAGPIGLAVLLSGFGAVTVRGSTAFPAWLGWVSLVLAVIGLIPPISWALTPLVAVWSIVVAVLLLRRRTPATA